MEHSDPDVAAAIPDLSDEDEGITYEACPDIEVSLQIYDQSGVMRDKMPANINTSKNVFELKKALASHLQLEARDLRMEKNGQVLDDNNTLFSYGVMPDDTLQVIIEAAQH